MIKILKLNCHQPKSLLLLFTCEQPPGTVKIHCFRDFHVLFPCQYLLDNSIIAYIILIKKENEHRER